MEQMNEETVLIRTVNKDLSTAFFFLIDVTTKGSFKNNEKASYVFTGSSFQW